MVRAALNCVPLSDMSACGMPKRQMMFRQMNFSAAAAVIVAKASASTHLVKYSTATIIQRRCPIALGNDPTMSIPHKSKGQAPEMDI